MGYDAKRDFPPVYLEELDTKTFIEVLQDAADNVRFDITELVRQGDYERADETFVDGMLFLLGWRVEITLTLLQKRKLVRDIIDIYLTKGTASGLIAAALNLLGLTITIDEAIDDAWRIGISLLGVDTILGSTVYLLHFFVHAETTITATEETELTALVNFMKPGFATWSLIKDL